MVITGSYLMPDKLVETLTSCHFLTLLVLKLCVHTRPLLSCSVLHMNHVPHTSRTCACHMYMHFICVGRAVVWRNRAHPLSSERLAEVHLGFSRVSLAQILLNICFISSCQNIAASHVETTAESMSDEEFFKAEKVFIKECVEGGAGNMIQTGTKLQVSTTWVVVSQCHVDL